MTSKALVAYASKHGSTREIAQAVAEEMQAAGVEVDCRDAGEVRDLDGYDAVVLGSAVYMKRWRSEARAFLRRHARALAAMPFWVFSSGPCGEGAAPDANDGAGPDLSWCEPPRIVERLERMNVREHVIFGGRVPEDGFMGNAMRQSSPPELLDMRDWDEIREWAAKVAAALEAGAPVAR
jgi:menaquinone-dependent protoporphyrinogen oxidase